MDDNIKPQATAAIIFGMIAGLWAWLVMLSTYMTTTGIILGRDLLSGLSLPAAAIIYAICIHRKAVQNSRIKNVKKRLIFTYVWCSIPSLLLLLVAAGQLNISISIS